MASTHIQQLQRSLSPENLEQMSLPELTQLMLEVLNTIPVFWLIIGFLLSMLLPALFTLFAASFVNIPYKGYPTAYLAVSIIMLTEFAVQIGFMSLGINSWAILFIVHIAVALLVYAVCYNTTALKAFMIILFDVILKVSLGLMLVLLI